MKIKLKVFRYDPAVERKPQYKTYEVHYSKGMFVLDALNYIQRSIDATLAFRWECRMGICGTCGIMLNGRPVLSCTAQLDPVLKENLIEPLTNFPIEKDLIVDISQVLEKFKRIRPYLEKIQEVRVAEKEANKSKPFRKCIECGCCIAGSKTVQENQYGVMDPMALVKIARFVTDPRDSLDRKSIAKQEGIDKYTLKEGKALTRLCPRSVPIAEAIQLLKNS